MTTSSPIRSAPALLIAWRQQNRGALPMATAALLELSDLVPMYRVDGETALTEAATAAHLASDLAERLRRLASAYGEWDLFEPAPYFDLLPAQAAQIVRIVERVSTVHVTFFADLLLPSFQTLASALISVRLTEQGLDVTNALRQQELANRWQNLLTVLDGARRRLANDAGYLAANGANEERNRWRAAWEQTAPASSLPDMLIPFERVPTLTLSIDFPLPANRQPGRLRRLRRVRERNRRAAAVHRRTKA